MGSPINWLSSDFSVFINPKTPQAEKVFLEGILFKENLLKSHIYMLTSGTSGNKKWVALSKEAMLVSAHSVNEHIEATKGDVWLNCLPLHHVGGLSIYARAFLTGSCVVDINDTKWDPHHYVGAIKQSHATLSSLVPTQVYDLVINEQQCPNSLRAVFVGGSSLSKEFYFRAIELGWPILPTYGMTECCSQVATAKLNSWDGAKYPVLLPLKHVTITTSESVQLKSKALLTGYIVEQGFVDPKIDGWFTTEDIVTTTSEGICGISRKGCFAKIAGENVDLQRLQNIIDDLRLHLRFVQRVDVVAVNDVRLGKSLELHVEGNTSKDIETLIEQFHQKAMPFERIKNVQYGKSLQKKILHHSDTKSK